jgi:hypothetical protein
MTGTKETIGGLLDKDKSEVGSGLGTVGGTLLGGLFGGPVGAAIGGTVGGTLGRLVGEDSEKGNAGAENLGAGPVTVGGGGVDPADTAQAMVRFLREISMNIQSLTGDGIIIRGDRRRTGQSII